MEWFQSYKTRNHHDDIVLKTPSFSSGERILLAGVRVPDEFFSNIMDIAYPDYGRVIPDCIEDLRRNAYRNILAINNVSSLNGLFGLKSCVSMNYNQNHFFGQLWAARTVNNCDLVELPVSVTDLLFIGENRNFNFLESLKPLNIRKEAENCLPAAFQFWAKPQAKKLLDNQIYSLIFGGKWQLDNIIEDSCDEGMLSLLLTAVNIQKYFGDCPRFEASFSKENFVDSSYENFKKLPKGQQNISLLKEFEKLLLEFHCPSRYLLEIFNNEVKREDYCVEKRQYRSRKNILMIYRGMLFF